MIAVLLHGASWAVIGFRQIDHVGSFHKSESPVAAAYISVFSLSSLRYLEVVAAGE